LRKSYLLMFAGRGSQSLETNNAAVALLEDIGDEVRAARARAVRISLYTRLGMMQPALAEVVKLEPLVDRLQDAQLLGRDQL
jgi:hypothetical protein